MTARADPAHCASCADCHSCCAPCGTGRSSAPRVRARPAEHRRLMCRSVFYERHARSSRVRRESSSSRGRPTSPGSAAGPAPSSKSRRSSSTASYNLGQVLQRLRGSAADARASRRLRRRDERSGRSERSAWEYGVVPDRDCGSRTRPTGRPVGRFLFGPPGYGPCTRPAPAGLPRAPGPTVPERGSRELKPCSAKDITVSDCYDVAEVRNLRERKRDPVTARPGVYYDLARRGPRACPSSTVAARGWCRSTAPDGRPDLPALGVAEPGRPGRYGSLAALDPGGFVRREGPRRVSEHGLVRRLAAGVRAVVLRGARACR